MAEKYENYHKSDIKLPFNLYFPDGSPVMAADPETGETKPLVNRLTPEEVRRFKGMGYKVELVENNRKVGIDKSQTRHDKGEDEE